MEMNCLQMENISNFLDAVKAFGVPEISCFQTVDLYENKQVHPVESHPYALHTNIADLQGDRVSASAGRRGKQGRLQLPGGMSGDRSRPLPRH